MRKTKEYIIKTSFLWVIALFMFSCDDAAKNIVSFQSDKEDIAISAEGGVEQIRITSTEEWVALASEPWLMITPANGVGTTDCSVVIDSTLMNGMRTATIRFTPNGQEPKTVTVRQLGFDKMIVVEQAEIEIEASEILTKRNFSAMVTTNVEFDVDIEYVSGSENWLSPSDFKIELDRAARPRTANIKFDWRMNPDSEVRVAKVSFVPADADVTLNEPAFMMITQKAAPKIEDTRAGDSLAILTIAEKLQSATEWDADDNLMNWNNVELWEETDKDLPSPDAVGRIKKVNFLLCSTTESIPQEVRYLKYLQSLSVYSNVNTMLLSIDLGSEVCELEHLEYLQIGSYGLVSLPDDFVKLGNTLETLDLTGNNFSSIPLLLTQENFPRLKSLSFTANRRWGTSDLRKANNFENGLGLHLNIDSDPSVRNLFLWDNLEELRLSYNYIEGTLPDFKVGDYGLSAYSQSDVDAFGGDTIQWLADQQMPKVLPHMKRLSINLNYLTGKLPDWILYHPHLMDWYPEILIFNQMEYGVNSDGKAVKFDNEPKNFEYYYEAFPKFRSKYEFNDEYED